MKISIDFEKITMTSQVVISFDQWCETSLPQHRHQVVHLFQPMALDKIATGQRIAMENHASKLM